MLRNLVSLFHVHGPGYLPVAERPAHDAEREENFRWVSQLFAHPAQEPLKSTELVDPSVQKELSDIGQFAEVAHGSINPEFVWKYITQLSKPDYPLNGYPTLSESTLVSVFHGSVADLQGYTAYWPRTKQLVVAFSGTSSLCQAIQALHFTTRSHPSSRGCGARVHSGFWSMYSGIRTKALSNLEKALREYDVREIVLTGHSMGAVMSSLFCIDILEERVLQPPSTRSALFSKQLKVVAFGAPRAGKTALAQLWHDLIEEFSVEEYSIKNYKDGVPMLPPYKMEYRHLSLHPLYLAYGRLWRISAECSEDSLFHLDPSAIANAENPFPRGGHNYYNGRDMELLQRRLKWFQPHAEDDTWDTLRIRFEKRRSEERLCI